MKRQHISTLVKLFSFVLAFSAFLPAKGQIAYDVLNGNNISARFNSDGQLFWDGKAAAFEAPKGKGINSISAAALWIGGLDANANLHMSAQTYRETGSDFWAGPLDTIKGNTDTNNYNAYNHVWKVSKLEIDSFREGLSKPKSILNWPGNGNTAAGYSKMMAPFVDLNNNGIYEPLKGDYPDIKGDVMLWWVFNDIMKSHGETRSLPMGIEVQASAYAFNCKDPVLANAIFIHYKIINRSSNRYDSTYAGMWTDLDIGNIFNDYVGCDTALNTYYGYNAINFDKDSTVILKSGSYSMKGYGKMLPAQAVSFLQGPTDDAGKEMRMSHFIYYNNDQSAKGNPKVATDYYNLMEGNWFNTLKLTEGGDGFGGNTPVNYAFPGDPDVQSQWSELSAANLDGDRRGLGSFGPFTLKAGATKEMTVAYSFHQASSGKSINSIRLMKTELASLIDMYKKGISPCSGVSQCANADSCVYPGDADHDKVADGIDPFYIAYAYGTHGTARPFASLDWAPQYVPSWNMKFPDGTDFKNADCNGDGVIDSSDVIAVANNISRSHNKVLDDGRAGDPIIKVVTDADTSVSGKPITGSVILGDANNPAQNVYGATFELIFDPAIFDMSTFSVDVSKSVLGGPNQLVVLSQPDTTVGHVIITVVKKDKATVTVKGDVITRWKIVPEPNVGGFHSAQLGIVNVRVVDANLTRINVKLQNGGTVINTSSIAKYIDLSDRVNLYPNPAREELYLTLPGNGQAQVRIYNLQGTVVASTENAFNKTMKINIAGLPQGFYFVEINTPQGRAVKKFSKIR